MIIKQLGSVLTVFLLISCGEPNKNKIDYTSFSCINAQSHCIINSVFGDILVTFNVKEVIPETPFMVNVDIALTKGEIFEQNLQLTGHLEGKTMYMGKIPLFFSVVNKPQENNKLTKQSFRSKVIIGSCNADPMFWTLWLTVANKQGSQQRISVDFFSRYQ
mgnify:CR=1 FL=1